MISDNESFCSDMSTVSEADRGYLRNPNSQRKVKKDMRLKFSNKRDVVKFHVSSDQSWNKPSSRRRIGRRISEKELLDKNRIDQISLGRKSGDLH